MQPEEYHKRHLHDEADDPTLAIRRSTDRCFHRVEEVTPDGFIVEGFLIPLEEVIEVVELDELGAPLPACRATTSPTGEGGACDAS